jgi:Dyp-type peroxidase family
MPPINLDTKNGIDDNGPEIQAIADDLQGNVLKSHGRGHTSHIFFKFNPNKVAEAKAFLKRFASTEVTSAKQQKLDIAEYKKDYKERFFINLFLSGKGYEYLEIPEEKIPGDPSFKAGMKASKVKLNDPPVKTWDIGFQDNQIHGMILIALGGKTRNRLDSKSRSVVERLRKNGLATVLCVDEGDGIKNANGDDLEHFGYVDGISQPKFFTSELPPQHDQWSPMMPLDLVLVPDKCGTSENSFGSYFVYRKLEQDVREFKIREEELGDELFPGGTDEEKEFAGAMLVGRFENGMPATLSNEDNNIGGTPTSPSVVGKINNFNYSGDANGAKCPFHAHIRKTNPRGESPFEPVNKERHHMMARRGIIYGKRHVHPNEATIDEMPTKDVGLLFMSFQAEIDNQFEFIQSTWANNENFVKPETGLDGVIGQGKFPDGVHRYARKYGDKNSVEPTIGFGGFVTLKGGEYFFAPCLSALKNF